MLSCLCAVAFNMCCEAKEAELKDWAIGLVNILYTGSWYGLVVMLVSALLALACGMFRFNDWPYGVAASAVVVIFALLTLGGLFAVTIASGVSDTPSRLPAAMLHI